MEKIFLFHPPPPPFDLLKSPGFRFYGFRCEVHAADPSQECNKPVNRNKSSLWVDSSNNQTAQQWFVLPFQCTKSGFRVSMTLECIQMRVLQSITFMFTKFHHCRLDLLDVQFLIWEFVWNFHNRHNCARSTHPIFFCNMKHVT